MSFSDRSAVTRSRMIRALRQGIWLHARSRSGLRAALKNAGLEVERIQTHGPGGVLIEAQARSRS